MPASETTVDGRPRLGVSACLLGRPVRFDGGHRRDTFVCERLAAHVELVPVCPEVELGLSVPRETLRLTGPPTGARLIGLRSGRDYTDEMKAYADARLAELAALPLDGYVLKKDSPSCGLTRVRVYGDGPRPGRTGRGLFAQRLRERLLALPVTEEGRLRDAGLRESFLHQLFTHHRLRLALVGGRAGALVASHAAHKFLFLAHSPARQRYLGRVVADLKARPLAQLMEHYRTEAMFTLAQPTSRGKHANVLSHILGFLSPALAPAERRELVDLVDEFRAGQHDLGVPLALLVHHLRRIDPDGWLAGQIYLQPFPRALGPWSLT
jgi:uncharacterized protein YbbK (DUF523 family)/uncharacterized protein YbgA (DUF1722 family)